jgi:hypothetical protein
VPLGLPDLRPDLRDAKARHYDSSFFFRSVRRLGFVSAAGSAACSGA